MLTRLKKVLFSRLVLVLLALALVSAGAVYAGTQIKGTEKKRRGATAQVRADGSLTRQPRPLSLDEVARTGRGSPSRAVMHLWYWGQWGSTPNIISAYDPTVVRRVGAGDTAGAYSNIRASLLASRPRIVDVSRGVDGLAFVSLEALSKNAPPEPYSFTLRKSGGRWVVVYDTLLESAIAAYTQFRRSPDPNGKRPPPVAVRAGLAAARNFRVAFLCRQRRGALGSAAVEASERC